VPNLGSVTTVYRLTKLEGSQRGGMNAALDAQIRGIAKTNNAGPFTIANELIAAYLGHLLGLPVPAGVVAEGRNSLYYLSLDVGKEQKQLPPIVATDFVAAEPWLAAGCIVFDIWIANPDRHPGNLARDPAFNPPRVSLIDHGHALLGTGAPLGEDRLDACRGLLGFPPQSHAVIGELTEEHGMREWAKRVAAVPDYMIEDACAAATAPAINVNTALAQSLATWLLLERRGAIDDLISANQAVFAKVTQWELGEGTAR
jgi:hypothetical protein